MNCENSEDFSEGFEGLVTEGGVIHLKSVTSNLLIFLYNFIFIEITLLVTRDFKIKNLEKKKT